MEPESPAAQLFSQCIVNFTTEPSTHAQPELNNLFFFSLPLTSLYESSQSKSSQYMSLQGFASALSLIHPAILSTRKRLAENM